MGAHMGRMRRTAAALVVALLGALAAACGSSPVAQSPVAAVSAVVPAGAHLVHPAPPTPSAASCTDSIAPPSTMPAPGAMPAGSWMARIQAHGHLVAGVDQNTFLWGYRDPVTGELTGFDIDMVRAVSQAIFGSPDRVTYVVVPNADRIRAVQDGEVDLVAETMTVNCERARSVDFSSVYYQAGQRILVPLGSSITGPGDLGGKRVCAADSSTSLQNLVGPSVAKGVQVWAVPNETDCLVMMQQGQVDAISTDDAILLGLAAQDPTTRIVGPTFSQEPYGMAISKAHPEFTSFVNGVLAAERSDGAWAQTYAEVLGPYAGGATPAPPVATYRAGTVSRVTLAELDASDRRAAVHRRADHRQPGDVGRRPDPTGAGRVHVPARSHPRVLDGGEGWHRAALAGSAGPARPARTPGHRTGHPDDRVPGAGPGRGRTAGGPLGRAGDGQLPLADRGAGGDGPSDDRRGGVGDVDDLRRHRRGGRPGGDGLVHDRAGAGRAGCRGPPPRGGGGRLGRIGPERTRPGPPDTPGGRGAVRAATRSTSTTTRCRRSGGWWSAPPRSWPSRWPPVASSTTTGRPPGTRSTGVPADSPRRGAVCAEVAPKVAGSERWDDDLDRRATGIDALRAELDDPGVAASTPVAVRHQLAGVRRRAGELEDEVADIVRTACDRVALRDELRGRLDAYRAKAAALGRAEDLVLDDAYGRARDALYVAPCDLDEATRLTEDYQRSIRSGARGEP